MTAEESAQRQAASAVEFDEHLHRTDGLRIANSLADGLTIVRDAFFNRVHGDVEMAFGLDSMLLPVAVLKTEAATNCEIEVYQVVEAALCARSSGYIPSEDGWFLDWLARLRLGESGITAPIAQRLAYYGSRSPDDRRLAFSRKLQQVLPEVSRAPLIMFRLFPLAIAIVVSLAFGDHRRADDARKRQITWLSSIGDCHLCHGQLLDNAEKCAQCGNPFWKYDWLTAD